jgi:hypothetical protein
LTHSLKPPGFNPGAYEVKTWFQTLLFQIQLVPLTTRLCLSMSDYHPETWNPMWSVSSILSGLVSFMYDTTPTTGRVGNKRENIISLFWVGESLALFSPRCFAVNTPHVVLQ